MPCPSHDELNAFAAGDLEPEGRDRVAAHLETGCAACRRELEAVEALRRVARSEALSDPPPWVLERAARVPEEAREGGLARIAGTLAALVFDTLRDPLAVGARSASSGARRMLYKASEYDIDVRVTAAGAGRVRVSGQVLPGPERPIEDVSNLEVALVAGSRAIALAATNDLGEFDLEPVPEGEYALAVEADDERLVVDPLPALGA